MQYTKEKMDEEAKRKPGWPRAGPGRPPKYGRSPTVAFRLEKPLYDKLIEKGGAAWAKQQITRLLTAEKPKLIKIGGKVVGAIERPRGTKKEAPSAKDGQKDQGGP